MNSNNSLPYPDLIKLIKSEFSDLSAFQLPYDHEINTFKSPWPLKVRMTACDFPAAWYQNTRAQYNALIHPVFKETLETVSKYCKNDHQFPPDIRRLVIINSQIQLYQPDLILEWGCGSSSSIFQQYAMDNPSCRAITVDSSSDWIQATKSKLSVIPSNYSLYTYKCFLENIPNISRFKRIYVYVDAPMYDEDLGLKHAEYEDIDIWGLKSLSRLLSPFGEQVKEFLIFIDSRANSLPNAYLIAEALQRKVQYYGNVIPHSMGMGFNKVLCGDVSNVPKEWLPFFDDSENTWRNFEAVMRALAMTSSSILY